MELVFDLSDSSRAGILAKYGNDPKFQAAVLALEKQISAYMQQDKVSREINMPRMLTTFFEGGRVGGVELLGEGTIRKFAAAVAMSNLRKGMSYAAFIRSAGGARRRRKSSRSKSTPRKSRKSKTRRSKSRK